MISKSLHKKLMKEWLKVGPAVYQKWNRIETRMPMLDMFLEHFKDMDVLELGCNAGAYGLNISKVAKSYIGVDQGDYYIKQANLTKKHMKCPTKFYHSYVNDLMKKDMRGELPTYNMIFATFVLYHLKDRETDKLEKIALPKCDKVFIMTRTSKRSPWKKYNSHQFHVPKNVAKWLQEAGFETTIEWHPTKKFAGILGIRPEEEKEIPEEPETLAPVIEEAIEVEDLEEEEMPIEIEGDEESEDTYDEEDGEDVED